MSLISNEYRALQQQFHTECPNYGISSRKYVEQVMGVATQIGTRDILDYGCGKCMLQKGIPYPIQNYDPCIPEYNVAPVPADFVVCTDVLEHIEPACVTDVLDDLQRLTKKIILLDISCREAKKILPDGRNAHINVKPANVWLELLLPRFDLHSYQQGVGMFHAILFAKGWAPLVMEGQPPAKTGEAPNMVGTLSVGERHA